MSAAAAWRPIIIMAFVVLALWQTYDYGYQAGLTHGLNEANQASVELVGKLKNEKMAIIHKLEQVDQKYTDELQEKQGEIDEAKREANEYQHITHKGDADDCPNISDEWVRVHNKAANLSRLSNLPSFRNAKTPGVDDGSTATTENYSAGYTKKQAIQTVTDNYATCSKYIYQLTALQKYLKTLMESEQKVNE